MSAWTHPICVEDWFRYFGTGDPIVLTIKVVEVCCFCLKETESGIYVRFNPAETLCGGRHGDD